MSGVQSLIVPVLVILQNRVDQPQRNNQQSFGGVDAQVLEEVRNDWCAMVGDVSMNDEASAVVTEIIPIVLLDASATPANNTTNVEKQATSKNRESVNMTLELNLAKRYSEVVQKFGAPPRSHLQSNLSSSQTVQTSTPPPPSQQQVHQLEP